jgi:hypothetical protein
MLLIHVKNVMAQSQDSVPSIPTDVLENVLEQIESADGELENNTFLEDLEERIKYKLNLNTASLEELLSLGVLSDIQALSILNYIKNYGEMQSIYELKGIIGMDKRTIDLLLPYVTVLIGNQQQYSLKDQLTKGTHQILYRYQQVIEQPVGYSPPTFSSTGTPSIRYNGDRTRQYFRYRYHFLKGISYGITMEKDPGEQYFQPGVKTKTDYLSGHLFIENKGIFKSIAIGDYEVNLGQGIMCFQSFGVGKSIAVNNVKRFVTPIKPHTSVNEVNFFRGAAATIGQKNWEVTGFVSYIGRDANVSVTDTFNFRVEEVSSLQITGLHRTNSELADRKSINQLSVGGRAGWKGRRSYIYVNALYNQLSSALKRDDQPYNKYAFNGTDLLNVSSDYSYVGTKWNFFGETGISQNGGYGTLNGFQFKPAPGVAMSILHRYYSKDFQTLYSNSFSENTFSVNEHGLYAGISFRLTQKLNYDAYADLYQFPWLKFGVDKPGTTGLDLMNQLTYTHNRKLEVYARVRFETKAYNVPDEAAAIDYVEMAKKSSLRMHFSYRPNDVWSFKTRGEFSWWNDGFDPLQTGFLFFQDINYNHPKGRFNLYARYAFFRTSSYDTRIYTYENDVLYSFSVPAFYGEGSRVVIGGKLHINRYVDIWLRFSQTFQTDRSTVGSGLDEINGNVRSDIKAQVRIKI